jgi:hypothetical protein
MSTFAGPYWKSRLKPEEGALAAARAFRDGDETIFLRGLHSMGGFTGGDGGANPTLAAFTRACVLIAKLTDDPNEREEAVDMAKRIAWRMYMTHPGRLPVVYKGTLTLINWIGQAYLDVFTITGDERFREAALDLAKAVSKDQDKDGAWPGPWKGSGHWIGGIFGPSEVRGNGGEAALWFLGRVRTQLNTKDFLEVEAKADGWVKTLCLPEMFWQNVGYHSGEMVPVQDTVAPHALSYAIAILDYAEGPARDLKLVAEIARWAEERHVDWTRDPAPKTPQTRPSCWGWPRAAGNGMRIAGSLAYVCARLAQETGDALWKAKCDALVQGILVAQDPLTGGLGGGFRREFSDVFYAHNYDVIDTAWRLMAVARMTFKKP